MASLETCGTVCAMPNMYVELGDDGFNRAGNVFLVLGAHGVFDDGPAAGWTVDRQGSLHDACNPFGPGTMRGGMPPFPTWGLGLGLRGTFGKRRGLPFATSLRLIKFLFQLGQARFEFRKAGGLLGNQGLRLFLLLHKFVVGHDVFKIHAGAPKGNPTFL